MTPALADRCVVIAAIIGCAILAITGCATPQINHIEIDGIAIVEHLDEDAPEGCTPIMSTSQGCYTRGADGKHHVWYSSRANECVKHHEQAHALGMRHTPWARQGDRPVAVVTHSGGGFEVGLVLHGC